MEAFRKRQRLLKRLLHALLIVTAVYIVVYIGAEPYLREQTGSGVYNYIAQLLIVLSLVFLFVYYSRYAKCDRFLDSAESVISDAGCYLTSREETDADAYEKAVTDDLSGFSYHMTHDVEANGLTFDTRAMKAKEFFYIVKTEVAEKTDVIAYSDAMQYDLTAVALKRKGNGVLLILCQTADVEAVALSKDITEIGRKAQLKLATAICELSTGRVYFLGNTVSKCQQMIANFVMNCDVPIKEQYTVKDKLPFQTALAQRLKDFSLKDFNNGKYNER